MPQVYNSPPNWPLPPANWQPPSGWAPDPAWGPAPYGWQFWSGEPAIAPGTHRDESGRSTAPPQYIPGEPLTRPPSAELAAGTTGRPPPALLVFAIKVTIGVVVGAMLCMITGALTMTRWIVATALIWTGFLVRAAFRWRA